MASDIGEEVIENERNKISLALSLKNLKEKAKEMGSHLYHRGVMGARVVTQSDEIKSVGCLDLKNFGSHSQEDYPGLPYLTIAVAIGST